MNMITSLATKHLSIMNRGKFFLMWLLLISGMSVGQSPTKFSYQAIIRAVGGQALTNQPIGMRLSILQGSDNGNAVYVETHTATTNAQGLATLQIGGGIVQSGSIAQIDWANGPYFVKTETDPEGGSAYAISGTSPLLSVPYSLFSANGMEKGTQAGQMMYWNGSDWILIAPGSTGQTLTMCNGVPTWGACPPSLATLTTTNVQSVTSSSAISGGSITSDGGGAISARGVCWSTSPNPTVALSTKTVDGTGTGSFSSTVSGLTSSTTYFLRAYATNSIGTGYGNELTITTFAGAGVTDIDGNSYETVVYGNQEWMKENLRVSRYTNGDAIGYYGDSASWGQILVDGASTPAWCYLRDNSANDTVYGKLYNFFTILDSRGLCPVGWHVASDPDWQNLESYFGMPTNFLTSAGPRGDAQNVGGKLKSISSLWISPNNGATNESGFSGLPGGRRYGNGRFYNTNEHYNGEWWTSTGTTSTNAWYRSLSYGNGGVYRACPSNSRYEGRSIRCVKN